MDYDFVRPLTTFVGQSNVSNIHDVFNTPASGEVNIRFSLENLSKHSVIYTCRHKMLQMVGSSMMSCIGECC